MARSARPHELPPSAKLPFVLEQARRARPEADVYVVGLGIPENAAATLEAIDVVRRCKVLFVNQEEFSPFRRLCPKVESYGLLGGEDRWEPAVARVLKAARREGPVSFAIYGHPMLYEPVAARVLEGCRKKGLTAAVVGGVSSIDVALALLAHPILPGVGLQVGDVRFFIDNPPPAKAAVFIYKAAMTRDLLPALAKALLEHRPPTAPAAVVERANYRPVERDIVRWLTVGAIPKAFGAASSIYGSLFVPAA